MTGSRPPVAVEVDGLRRLQRELRRAGADLGDLKDANAKVATVVATEGARRAPRRSGRLARSGRGNRAAGRASVIFGGATAPHAAPIHWGWPDRNIEPQPFAVEAAEDTRPEWLDIYNDELQRVADSVGGTY